MEYRLVFTTTLNYIKALKNMSKIKSKFHFEKINILSKENFKCFGAEVIIQKISNDEKFEIKDFCSKLKIDSNFTKHPIKNKKLLIADMDSTIIKEETLDEIANLTNNFKEISKITKLAMEGKISFEESLSKRIYLLKGTNIKILDKVKQNINFNSGAKELINIMNKNGAFCYLVSGGFTVFTNFVCKELNFFNNFGNKLNFYEKQILGDITYPIIDGSQKKIIMTKLCKKHNISDTEVIAVGDGSNDLDMLKKAGMGVSFYGKEILKKKIKYQINFSDLTSLLYLQGYNHTQF